ncbi:MAG: T9SS type A sorting domain-containing protein [Crocinitomicaceae bacterium]|nr:T9SS type A sorting domain-containing protein [Crocinitomicaceae bacterium]MDG1657504.1 T9SS type A sorting domain-containing protein [Crocinitomicaceae bacterium]
MKRIITLVSLILIGTSQSFAQNDVESSAADNWIAYMNIFDLPADGGAYQFGSPWALVDVKSTADLGTNTLILQPNFSTYAANPTDAFWVNQTTGDGNKEMEALTFVEPGPSYNGVDLTFHGRVLSHTLDTGYTAQFFIKALDSLNGYADVFGGAQVYDLPTSGNFTVSVTAAEIPSGLLVQYGYSIRGVNSNPLDEASLGSVVIGAENAGINELDASDVVLYPNPTTNSVSITSNEQIIGFEILNLSGQVVISGANPSAIDVSSLEAGTYFARVELENTTEIKKLIKK